jgi:hypothetical protein
MEPVYRYPSEQFDEAASYILGFPKEKGDHGK